MNEQQKPWVLAGLLILVLLVAAGWSTSRMFDQRATARAAAADLAECRRIAANIASLRKQDSVAQADGDADAQERDIAQRISDAAQKAGLAGEWNQGITHTRAVQVGETPYKRKPAELVTRGLTLAQLTALMHELTYDSPLTVSELRLNTPRGEDPGDRWDADITLSFLIYAPPAND